MERKKVTTCLPIMAVHQKVNTWYWVVYKKTGWVISAEVISEIKIETMMLNLKYNSQGLFKI